MRFLISLLPLLAGFASAAIPADEIDGQTLPGWEKPLPSKQYSGYISVDDTNGRYLHYWFVESEQDPLKDPLVLWLNGGPGCSSLDGYLYEHGPLHFDPASPANATLPNLVYNPYTWSKIANVLFLEAPAGVGFSYSNTQSDYNTDDTKTANDNYEFLLRFYKAYPEFNNTLFISGESYAGVYVPTLVDTIRQGNEAGVNPRLPLEGFMVGNGCTGNSVGACSAQGTGISVEFLQGHALYSPALYQEIKSTCTDLSNPTDQCNTLLQDMSNEVGNVNVYDVYDICINGGMLSDNHHHRHHRTHHETRHRVPRSHPLLHFFKNHGTSASKVGGPVECIDGIAAYNYLNNDAVRSALHVQSSSQGDAWHICTSNINYNSNTVSLYPIYPTLIKNYRTLIYNGDADACVPWNDNQAWTSNLGIPVKEEWRSWQVDNQVAGYVTVFDSNDFTFLTVKGAGHMVPQYKPVQAFAMFERFITNQPF